MRRPEVDRMRALLVEAITTLCRSGLQYSSNMKVEGLIGITLDEADIILVNLNKCYSTGLTEIEGGKTPKEKSQQEQAANSDISDCFETGSPTVRSPEPFSNRRKRKSDHYGGSSPPHPSKRLFEPSDASTPSKSSQRHRTPGDSAVSPPPRAHSSSTADTDEGTQENAPLSSTSLASPSSQTDFSKRTAAQSSHVNQSKEPIVKIEIESDPEVEEVKSEPGHRDSCSLTGSSFYQSQLSNTTIVQTALPTYSTAYPVDTSQAGTSSDYQGELHISQLPAEFAAATQSDTAVPVSMFTSSLAAPMPGPSGLNIQPQGGAAFSQADQMATQAALLQANKPGLPTEYGMLWYETSRRNHRVAVYGGYRHHLSRSSKVRRYWRCIFRQCPGSLITDLDGVFLSWNGPHPHPAGISREEFNASYTRKDRLPSNAKVRSSEQLDFSLNG